MIFRDSERSYATAMLEKAIAIHSHLLNRPWYTVFHTFRPISVLINIVFGRMRHLVIEGYASQILVEQSFESRPPQQVT